MGIWVVVIILARIDLLAPFANQLTYGWATVSDFNHTRRFLPSVADNLLSVALSM